MDTDQQKKDLLKALSGAERIFIGIGGEWRLGDDGRDVRLRSLGDPVQKELREAYAVLWSLVRDKDYYVVTTVVDGAVYDTDLDNGRVAAPCGDIHWRQCSKACIEDIWEEGEAPNDICPHYRALLTGNTVGAKTYIEEGYLPRWETHKKWQTGTLDRRLVTLELGEGFKTPTATWRLSEKIGFFNQKLVFHRIHETFFQISKETGERATGIQVDSVAFIHGLADI